MPTVTEAQEKALGIGLTPNLDTCLVRREIPEDTIARLETRVRLMVQSEELTSELCRSRGLEIESLTVSNQRAYGELLRCSAAIERGRELLHVFAGEPEAFVTALAIRQSVTVKHLGGILDWLRSIGMSADSFRAETPGLYPRTYTNSGMAQIMEAIAIMLELAAKSIQDGVTPAIPEGGSIGSLSAWLGVMRESLMQESLKEPGPQGPVYYCPTCQRHVAPEDVKPYYPDVPSYTGKDHYHDRGRGGCGEMVNSSEAPDPAER